MNTNEELKTRPDPFETHEDRNWTEDYAHENGNYINKCYRCQLYFKGHKRRPECRKCHNAEPDWAEIAKMQKPEDNKCAHAGCWSQGEMVGFARCMTTHVEPLQAKLDKSESENQKLREQLKELRRVIESGKMIDLVNAVENTDKLLKLTNT